MTELSLPEDPGSNADIIYLLLILHRKEDADYCSPIFKQTT